MKMIDQFRGGGWLQERREPSQYIFRRQNQQDQVMTAHGMREESGMILGLLTPTYLTFKVLLIPDLG